MANVTFEEEPRYAPRSVEPVSQGSIIRLMYRLGFAKTQKDANVVLGGIIGVCVLLSVTMFVFVTPRARPVDEAKLKYDIERTHASENHAATPQ